MKKVVLITCLLFSSPIWAAQCRVDVKNEVHLNGQQIEVHKTSGEVLLMDNQNNVYVQGKPLALDAAQRSAVERYRESVNEALPKAKKIASDGLALANDILDDIATSIEAPGAFDNAKQAMRQFYADIESRYYNDKGDMVLPAQTFESMTQTWQQDFEKAKALFNQQVLSDAFTALSEKMKAEGGKMTNTLDQLKAKVMERLQEHSQDLQNESRDFCDSLDDAVKQEQDLHNKIPELKNYQVFAI